MRIFLPFGVVVAVLAFLFWSRMPGNLPSSFFDMMDRDHNWNVSIAEWRAELHDKTDWVQREWDFHAMDCNQDQRLSWLEYRRVVFKGGDRCGKNPDITTRPRLPGSYSRCENDPITGAQSCVIWSGDGPPGPIAGPMQELKIP
ncbi:MAG: hypothetical protein ABW171_17740 [Steroidobacter sp.]